jgi:hypothetical protein
MLSINSHPFTASKCGEPSAAGPHEQRRRRDCELSPSLALQHGLLHPAKAEHTGGEDKDSSKPQPGQPISNHYLIRKPPQVRHGRLHRIALCRGDAVGDSHHSLSQPAHKPRPRALPSIIVRHGGRSGMAFGACIIPLMPCLRCCCLLFAAAFTGLFAAPKLQHKRSQKAQSRTPMHHQHRDSAVSPPGIETSIRAACPPWLAALPQAPSYPNHHLIPSPNLVQCEVA